MCIKLDVLRKITDKPNASENELNDFLYGAYSKIEREKYGYDISLLNNKSLFKTTYSLLLAKNQQNNPEHYGWPIGELMAVTSKMCDAIDKGTFNKDSETFKMTCKILGLKHTYKAIFEFFNKEAT